MSTTTVKQTTSVAPPNIAVIKYWGKRNKDLILPTNSSLSVTLSPDHLKTTTTAAACPTFTEDAMWLNGEQVGISTRVANVLKYVRDRAGDDWNQDLKIHINSVNDFPTAAGLASSAAGLACLAHVLCTLLGAKEEFAGENTIIARLGSGSACRSLDDGYVRWAMGERLDGKDSVATQVAGVDAIANMKILVCVVSDQKKHTSSTAGMQTTIQTSELSKHRFGYVVPARMQEMEKHVTEGDFESFAKLTMRDSNQFHATCLDTYPPITYMNDTSRKVVGLVTDLNEAVGKPVAAYTFDAGPNAVLFCQDEYYPTLLSLVLDTFAPRDVPLSEYIRGAKEDALSAVGLDANSKMADLKLEGDLISKVQREEKELDQVRYLIATHPGKGAHTVEGVSLFKAEGNSVVPVLE